MDELGTKPPEPPEIPEPPETAKSRKAAALLALVGLLELALIAPVVIVCLLVLRPTAALQRQVGARLTADQWLWAQQTARMAAPVVLLLGAAPAVAYIMLARPVRRRRRWAVLAVRFLLLVQFIELLVLAAQRFPDAAQSFRDGLPVHVTVNVLAFGTPLVLVGYTFWRLGGLTQPGGEI